MGKHGEGDSSRVLALIGMMLGTCAVMINLVALRDETGPGFRVGTAVVVGTIWLAVGVKYLIERAKHR